MNVDQPVNTKNAQRLQQGQSLVLIAVMMLSMLAFVGLAVDVGFVWLRGSQLTKAVDAATLAGASELGDGVGSTLTDANAVAKSFLYANDIPPEVVEMAENNSADASSLGSTILGARTYALTITWPVELYFLRVVGWREIDLTRSATAAYFPLVDIYASRRVEDGVINTSTQSIFGPQICTSFGDPFSPSASPWRWYNNGVYQYRIAIPADYEARTGQSILRVELFDPDTYNKPTSGTAELIVHTNLFSETNAMPYSTSTACGSGSDRVQPCLIRTCEWEEQGSCGGVDQFGIDDINPFWFVRIDENRGAGTPPGNGNCGQPSTYTNGYNTRTNYSLFYFRQDTGGTIRRVPLASYTGQTFDPSRDYDVSGGTVYGHGTDLQWVSPGAPNPTVLLYDSVNLGWGNRLGGAVPTDCGSSLGGYSEPGDAGRADADRRCPGLPVSEPGPGTGFEIDLNSDTTGILRDPSSGLRFVYLNVTPIDGASENDFEIWAGPPYDATLNPALGPRPSDVNLRNLFHLNNPGIHDSGGASVFALGTLPMNSLFSNWVTIPLLYVGPQYAGRNIEISLFDPDSGTQPPLTVFFDTINCDPITNTGDYCVRFNAFNCGGSCNDAWVGDPNGGTAPFTVRVPDYTDDCTNPSDPTQAAVCTPFYGGVLMIYYRAGAQDTYRWLVTLPSLPFLVE